MHEIHHGNESFPSHVWKRADGRVGDVFSYDTETTAIDFDRPDQIPDVVLATAFNGNAVYLIRREDLGSFWGANQGAMAVMHTAAFDISVTGEACGFSFVDMCDNGRVIDVSILYRLSTLAREGGIPPKHNLAKISRELLGVELAKDEAVRCSFGQFLVDGRVDYPSIPLDHLEYAARDAIATFDIAALLLEGCLNLHRRAVESLYGAEAPGQLEYFGPLSHHVQLRGDLALDQVERRGIRVDRVALAALQAELAAEADKHRIVLARNGYVPGQDGNSAVYDKRIAEIEARRGITIPVAGTSGRKSQREKDLLPYLDEEFIGAFLGFQSANKIGMNYLEHLAGRTRVHPRYNPLLVTGRTSCSSPNIQNLPRIGRVREVFVPAEGHVFIACDYVMLELCALAQITYKLFGYSRMRDLLNENVDLHRYFAAQILGVPMEGVSKEARQKAKALNFGVPGGMGAAGLREYAAANYGVQLSEQEAVEWRAAWMGTFPEMERYLAEGNDLAALASELDLESYPCTQDIRPDVAAMIVIRIAGGNRQTSAGRAFRDSELRWAWQQIERLAGGATRLSDDIAKRKGSRELQQAIKPGFQSVVPSGRIRSGCTYCESRNTPFQGLAADGAKLALYDLSAAGFRIVAFIHDEVIIELPEAADYRPEAERISEIMIAAMHKVIPDVAIRTECAVMRRWSKRAERVEDSEGRILCWDPTDQTAPMSHAPHGGQP